MCGMKTYSQFKKEILKKRGVKKAYEALDARLRITVSGK